MTFASAAKMSIKNMHKWHEVDLDNIFYEHKEMNLWFKIAAQ